MEFNKVHFKGAKYFFPFIFLLLATALIAVGVVILSYQYRGYVENSATIVEIVEEYDSFDDLIHKTFVDYTFEGINYSHIDLQNYESSYRVGKIITILVNPDNPLSIKAKGTLLTFILLFGFGGLCVILFVVSIVNLIRSNKHATVLKNSPTRDINDRVISAPEKFYFLMDTKRHVKFRFYIEDKDRHNLYEGYMDKFHLFKDYEYKFIDHIRMNETDHKVGKTVTSTIGNGSIDFPVESTFTYDGYDIWDYLAHNGVTVSREILGIFGFKLSIYHNGNLIAVATSSSIYVHEEDAEAHPKGSKFVNRYFYRIEGQRNYLDVIFLVLFAYLSTEG